MRRTLVFLVSMSVICLACGDEQEGPRVVNGCVIEPGTQCRNAVLAGVSLVGQDMSGADLRGAILQGSDLSFIELGGADLSSANLGSVNLTGANLSGGKLFNANLVGARLGGAQIENVDWTDAVCPDGAVANTSTGCVGHLVP